MSRTDFWAAWRMERAHGIDGAFAEARELYIGGYFTLAQYRAEIAKLLAPNPPAAPIPGDAVETLQSEG